MEYSTVLRESADWEDETLGGAAGGMRAGANWGLRLRRTGCVSALLIAVAVACGARSGLLVGELLPCDVEGVARTCVNACGQGNQVCLDGVWQPCDAAGERTCTGPCGEGRAQCADGAWTDCQIPTVRACATDCGTGEQICTEGIWSPCDASAEEPCSDACGVGTRECHEGQWTACSSYAIRDCESACGPGSQVCRGGTWGPCQGPEGGPPRLEVTVRDFLDSHPDFEIPSGGVTRYGERGLVEAELGADGLPVYAADPLLGTDATTGQANFDQWYRDVAGVNQSTTVELQLSEVPGQPGTFEYLSDAFFPIDGQLFGNQGRRHNYHFTLALETRFRYSGGEVFSFSGDDDLWIFLNHRLALDLGGLHEEQSGTIDLDARAASLGLVLGEVYPFHLFFAERHTVESHFNIQTTIAEWHTCE